MRTDKIQFGRRGEDAAVSFLEKHGYKILERNFRNRLGEIDIIARDGRTICFIEVKARSTRDRGSPLEAITPLKQHKLSQMALFYLKQKSLTNAPARFDVISIQLDPQGHQAVSLLKNAFDLSRTYSY